MSTTYLMPTQSGIRYQESLEPLDDSALCDVIIKSREVMDELIISRDYSDLSFNATAWSGHIQALGFYAQTAILELRKRGVQSPHPLREFAALISLASKVPYSKADAPEWWFNDEIIDDMAAFVGGKGDEPRDDVIGDTRFHGTKKRETDNEWCLCPETRWDLQRTSDPEISLYTCQSCDLPSYAWWSIYMNEITGEFRGGSLDSHSIPELSEIDNFRTQVAEYVLVDSETGLIDDRVAIFAPGGDDIP